MDTFGENPRGLHALALLQPAKSVTLPGLIGMAYDPHLTAFDRLLPPLFGAYDALPAADSRRARLAEPVERLRRWDRRWSLTSTETSLAVFWGEALGRAVADPAPRVPRYEAMATAPAATQLAALGQAVERLRADFGRAAVPWGEINRFQRLTGDLVQPFSDAKPSTPVPFTSAIWGSLASFGAKPYPGTKRWYGTLGNSFVAAVEFGPRVRARAVSAGGQSGDPRSPHFTDQAGRYAAGNLRPVYFHPEELNGHIERAYRPGD